MRVAIVHYWLVNMRGGERVVKSLCDMYPQADIYTHVVDLEQISERIRRHKIQTTFVGRLPWARQLYKAYLPIMQLALEQLDLREYDLVISSESGPAKGVLTRPDTVHICYCHTPMRYAWSMYQEYIRDINWVARWLLVVLLHRVRKWDAAGAVRVDYFVANSHNVARRIRKYYRRDAFVITPPVNLARFGSSGRSAESGENDYYLCVGQLVPYKQVGLAVAAFTSMGKLLIVVGEGQQRAELARVAGPTVRFVNRIDDGALREHYAGCRALIFTAEEDFGIVPLEAMASGKPVIAFGRGGALETVVSGSTGLFFAEQTVESLVEAVDRFEQMEDTFDPVAIRAHAESFSEQRFQNAFHDYVNKTMKQVSDYAGVVLSPATVIS